tara:strand:+ start:234 stop:464 length:231 start_codon:yes stop_codon:yes gene_type:complete
MKVLKIKNSNFQIFLEENNIKFEDVFTLCENSDFVYIELRPELSVNDNLKLVETVVSSYEAMFTECNKNKDHIIDL